MMCETKEPLPDPDEKEKSILKDLGIEPVLMESGIEVTMKNLIELLVELKDTNNA